MAKSVLNNHNQLLSNVFIAISWATFKAIAHNNLKMTMNGVCCYLCSPEGTCAAIFSDATERRGSQVRLRTPQAILDPNQITVAVVRRNVSIIKGELAGRLVEMMLNSGSAVSFIMQPEIIT